MAYADCECCGQPTMAPDPVPVETEECDRGRYNHHMPEHGTPVVLCYECTEDGEGCGPWAWHCVCDRACDGSACPGEQRSEA